MGSKIDLEKIWEHFPRGNLLPRKVLCLFFRIKFSDGSFSSILTAIFRKKNLQIEKYTVKNELRKNLRALSQRVLEARKSTFTDFWKKIFLPSVQLVFDCVFSKNRRKQITNVSAHNWARKNPRALSQRDSPSAKLLFLFFRKTYFFGPKSRHTCAQIWMLVENLFSDVGIVWFVSKK